MKKAQKNNYSFYLAWSAEDEGYIATCPEFPGLSAFGETAEEAIAEAQVALELFIETYQAKGKPLPEPSSRQLYSGQFRVRMPKSLHQKLVERAETEGVSLNTLVVSYLSEAVGTRQKSEDVPQLAIQRGAQFGNIATILSWPSVFVGVPALLPSLKWVSFPEQPVTLEPTTAANIVESERIN